MLGNCWMHITFGQLLAVLCRRRYNPVTPVRCCPVSLSLIVLVAGIRSWARCARRCAAGRWLALDLPPTRQGGAAMRKPGRPRNRGAAGQRAAGLLPGARWKGQPAAGRPYLFGGWPGRRGWVRVAGSVTGPGLVWLIFWAAGSCSWVAGRALTWDWPVGPGRMLSLLPPEGFPVGNGAAG